MREPRTWRGRARPIIAKVIQRVGTDDIRRLERELREAFPWGPREHHPYRIWRDEINIQLGRGPLRQPCRAVKKPCPGQLQLFD